MKDIVISKKRIVLEVLYFITCLILAKGMNIYAIKKYNTSWDELWSQWLTVILLSFLLYGLFTTMRLAMKFIIMIFKGFARRSVPASVQSKT